MAQTKEGSYKADSYSLGLVIWEIMNDGDEFNIREGLMNGETELEFLDRICADEDDGLLSRVFARIAFETLISRSSSKRFETLLKSH